VSLTLSALGWTWRRVGGSHVAHLTPATILRGSRSACNRLALWDLTLELPSGLLGETPLCKACAAYGARGGGA
jgi:hypothetical protein